jgi:VWFA-related protein
MSLIYYMTALLHAQVLVNNQTSLEPTAALTIREQVQEVSILLTVTDRKGRLVHDLSSSDFTIQDNGESPKRITYFQRQADLPLRIAVLIDTSGSVTSNFGVEQKTAAIFLSNVLRPKSDLALIIGFSNTPLVVQPATNNKDRLSAMIDGLQVRGETAVFDAVWLASQELGKINDVSPARRVIVLITDGQDNASHLNLQQTIEMAQRNDCFVYVLQINTFITSESEIADRAMAELSKATGGQVLHADNQKKLVRAFSTIEEDLRSQYAIGYTPANLTPDGSFHRLIVGGPKKLRIHHREGYFAR